MNDNIIPLICGALAFGIVSVLFVLFMASEADKLLFTVGLFCGFVGWFGRAFFELFAKGRQDE